MGSTGVRLKLHEAVLGSRPGPAPFLNGLSGVESSGFRERCRDRLDACRGACRCDSAIDHARRVEVCERGGEPR